MNNIRKLRKENGLTLKQLANELSKSGDFSITSDGIAKYERGDREPSVSVWQKFAEYFNVSLPYIQGRELSHEEKISEIASVLFEAYTEHETYTDQQGNTHFYFTNIFKSSLDDYLTTNHLEFDIPQTESFDNEDDDYINSLKEFRLLLSELFESVLQQYDYLVHKDYYTGFSIDPDGNETPLMDENKIISIAQFSFGNLTESRGSLGSLQNQLLKLNNLLSDRTKQLHQGSWKTSDNKKLVEQVNTLKESANNILNQILESLHQ